jgi:hypothetical protein
VTSVDVRRVITAAGCAIVIAEETTVSAATAATTGSQEERGEDEVPHAISDERRGQESQVFPLPFDRTDIRIRAARASRL